MKRKCEYCGTEYIARQDNQRFCKTSCAHEWWIVTRKLGLKLLRERDAARSQTYYGRELAEAAENPDRYAAVGAEQLAPFPTANGNRWPDGDEPLIEGNGLELGVALGGGSRD
jgi:hypothetical protein